MLKKILPLFFLFNILLIAPVHADKEYKFTLNKDLENKQIIYEWDNHIENFSFQMISPSNQIYSLGSYDLLNYDEDNNKVNISFSNLQSGQWKVIFKGDSNPVGLNNQIVDYYPTIEEEPKESETVPENNESEKKDIIVIGAETNNTEEKSEESEEIFEENTQDTEENSQEQLSNEEELKLKEKEDLALIRESERKEASQSKKDEKVKEEQLEKEKELEAQREASEVTLNFEESVEPEETNQTEDNEEKVIILGTDGAESPTTVNVEKSESDINMVNINADEERAKIENQIQRQNNKLMINNIIMVAPLIVSFILFILDLILKNSSKKKH